VLSLKVLARGESVTQRADWGRVRSWEGALPFLFPFPPAGWECCCTDIVSYKVFVVCTNNINATNKVNTHAKCFRGLFVVNKFSFNVLDNLFIIDPNDFSLVSTNYTNDSFQLL